MNQCDRDNRRAERQKYQVDYYNDLATDFDEKCSRENSNHIYKIEQIAETFFNNLNSEKKNYDFLEVGAGTGIHAYHFLKRHGNKINSLTLADISENMLKQAEERLQEFKDKTRYVVMPAEQFDVHQQFDGIYVSGSMHHFADPVAALAEIKKHLNPAGMVVICEPVVWNPVNFVKAMREIRAEYGQFRTQRGDVRGYLGQLGYQIVIDRVLHYRSGNDVLRKLIPYRKLEEYKVLNPLAVMFLLGARANSDSRR